MSKERVRGTFSMTDAIGKFKLFEQPGGTFVLAYLYKHEHHSKTSFVQLTPEMVDTFMRGLDNEIPFMGAIWFRRDWSSLVGKNFPNSMWSRAEPEIQNRHTYRNPEWLQRQRNTVAAHNAEVRAAASEVRAAASEVRAAASEARASEPRPKLIFRETMNLNSRARHGARRMTPSPVECSRCSVSGGRRNKKTRKV